jgi:hypothetical protein
MLRKVFLLALGLLVVPALIASLQAQNGPAPAGKTPSADDNPFGDGPAAKPDAAKPDAAKPGTAAEEDESNPFGGPPPKNLRPFGRADFWKPAATPSKPAVKKPQPAAGPKLPLRCGEKAILKALEEKTTVDFVETPLQDVVEYLQDKYRIPIKLDTNALKEAGVDASTPVTFWISGVPLRSALRMILSDLQLEWTVWCDVLWITSPAKAESDDRFVVKVYDVSDLVMTTPDRPYRGVLLPTVEGGEPASPVMVHGGGSGMGLVGKAMGPGSGPVVSGSGGMGMGGGMFAVATEANAHNAPQASDLHLLHNVVSGPPTVCAGDGVGGAGVAPAAPRNRMEALMDLIRDLVATKSWQENGGNGVISAQDNLLCVSQSFQTQCEVKAFLANLRAKRRAAPTVVVELQWLWLDGGQYGQLLGGAKPSSDGRTQLGVDAKALDLLGRKAPGFRGRIVCANGQLVHLASGDRRSIIVSAIPVVGGGIGYQPVVQELNAGVIVELRPTVAPGGTMATIDVQSMVTRWGKPQSTAQVGAAWPANIAGEPATTGPAGSGSCPVQRPNMPTQQLATTVRVPLGKPVALGGMTFAPADSAGMNEATDNPTQLYLIATTSIGK